MPDTPPIPSPKPRRVRWLVVLLAAVVGALLVDGNRIRPTGPAEGLGLNGAILPSRPAGSIRLATYNIRRGLGQDNRRDMDRTAQALTHFDLIGLNEVGPNQAQTLGEKLKQNWLYAPTEVRWWHEDFGNGLLSRVSISHWTRTPLPTGDGGCRNYVLLEMPFGSETLSVIVTHLGRSLGKERQREIVFDRFLSLPTPAVLMGDMNATASELQITRLLAAPGVIDALRSLNGPDRPGRIDWIFLRGLHATAAGMTDNGASDHPMVWAEIERAATDH